MVESGEGSSNFDSADIRTARQRKEWRRVVRGEQQFCRNLSQLGHSTLAAETERPRVLMK
jgi:hypothetical protein